MDFQIRIDAPSCHFGSICFNPNKVKMGIVNPSIPNQRHSVFFSLNDMYDSTTYYFLLLQTAANI